jgi:hypothetical protein
LNLDNIKEGKVYKNYKELCSVLDEPYKAGNSKKAQLKQWEEQFDFMQFGYQFKINQIHPNLLKKGTNEEPYIQIIQALILDLLVNEKDEILYISKNQLLKKINMINENYIEGKYSPNKLSTITKISKQEIRDFYQSSDMLFKRNLSSAIKHLEDQCLIDKSDITMVCFIQPVYPKNKMDQIKMSKEEEYDEYKDKITNFVPDLNVNNIKHNKEYRIATDSELRLILSTKKELLDKFNKALSKKYNDDPKQTVKRIKAISDLYNYKLNKSFFDELNSILFEQANIYFCYKGYKIIFNPKNIYKKWESLYWKLTEDDKVIKQFRVNQDISAKLNDNAERRHLIATHSHDDCIKNEVRKDKNYIKHEYILTWLLIQLNANGIKQDIEIINKQMNKDNKMNSEKM